MNWQSYLSHSAQVTAKPLLPTRRDEDWKYVSLRFLESLPLTSVALSAASVPAPLLADAHEVVFVDGILASKLPSGLSIETLSKDKSPSSRFSAWFEAFSALKHKTFSAKGYGLEAEDVFEQQNSRLWTQGLFLDVAENTSYEKPVVLRFISTGASGVRAPRVWAHVGKRSKLSVLEVFEGTGDSLTLQLPVVESEIKDSATLHWTRVVRGSLASVHIARTRFFQHGNSNLESLSVSLGSKLVRENFDVFLTGENATSRLHGLSQAGGDQVIDHHTRVDHVVGHCQTQQLYKSVLAGQSRVVFNGSVVIRHDSQKASSDQLNQSLLLSSQAEVDSKPQLEIWADDVKATHGSTVGQLNEEEIFYLLSRAIARDRAEAMIRQGFSLDLLMQVSDTQVRQWLLALQPVADQRLLL